MNYYDPEYFNQASSAVQKANTAITAHLVWSIIAIVVAVIGGIVLYFTVFNKKNENKYKGFLNFLYNLVHFKYFVLDDILRILYIILALAVTLLSFNYIGNYWFLVMLIGGNLSLRLSFELMMLFIGLCHDVRDINNKTKKKD